MSTRKLEKRLTAVESEVARLKSARAAKPGRPIDALEQLHGTFENDQAFQEAMRLGRKWREAQRPSRVKKVGRK